MSLVGVETGVISARVEGAMSIVNNEILRMILGFPAGSVTVIVQFE